MARQFKFEGQVYALPDGTPDQEAIDFISSQHPQQTAQAPLSNPPTWFDNLTSGLTGDPLKPGGDPIQQTIQGVGSSLGRTSQAWHDMFTGHPNPMTPVEMVPIFGPAAVDAGRMLATPGQRMKGLGAAAAVAAPPVMAGAPYDLPEVSIPGASLPGKAVDALNAATSPEVMSELPFGKTILKTKQAFKDKYNSLQPPPTPRPPQVIRDANSPAWAQNPSPVSAPPAPFEPVPATALPSGRVPGVPGRPAPARAPAPATASTPASPAPSPMESPAPAAPMAELNREHAYAKVNRETKNAVVALHMHNEGYTPESLAALTDDQVNNLIKGASKASDRNYGVLGSNYDPAEGRRIGRSPEDTRNEFQQSLQALHDTGVPHTPGAKINEPDIRKQVTQSIIHNLADDAVAGGGQ